MASSVRSFVVLVLSAAFALCVSGHEAQHDFVETTLSEDGIGAAVALDRGRGSVVGLWNAASEMHSQRRGRLLEEGHRRGRKLMQPGDKCPDGCKYGAGRKLSQEGRKLQDEGANRSSGVVDDVSRAVGHVHTAQPWGFERRVLAEVDLPINDVDCVTGTLT